MAIEPDKIVTFKTTAGIEVIAQIKAMDADLILVENPRMLVQVQHQGQIGLSFAPLLVAADSTEDVAFPISALMCIPVLASAEIREKYIELTSGIVLPQKSILMG